MKVLYIGLLKTGFTDPDTGKPTAYELASERNLEGYNYFTKTSVSQFMTFSAGTIAARTKPGPMLGVEEQGNKIYALLKDKVCTIVITDIEYPQLVGQSLCKKVSEEFAVKYPSTAHANWTKGSPELQMPELKEYIKKYQNPEEADSLMKIQKELDQTKIVMQKTIESVMERGEKIDDLVAKSDGLSAQSKLFYTQAKKQNSCCIVM